MSSPVEKYKAEVESKDARLKKKKRVILIGIIVSITVIATGMICYLILKTNIDRETILKQRITGFYSDLSYQINTNANWVEFIDRYAVAKAKESLSMDAVLLLDDANKGSQHLVRLLSPVSVRIYKADGKSADVLVDFSLGERVIGDPEQVSDVKKFIKLERNGSDWMISSILDRSARFDEEIKI